MPVAGWEVSSRRSAPPVALRCSRRPPSGAMAGGPTCSSADGSGTAVYRLSGGSSPRLSRVASNGTPGTSPIIAGGLLYIYDPSGGAVRVYRPPD